MIRILIENINIIPNEDIFQEKMSLLCNERKKAVEKYKQWDDRRRGLLAGILLQNGVEEILKQQGKMNDPFPEIIYKGNGKPYFADEEIYFNLSHSGDYVLCVLSDNEVGCDIQQIKPLKVDFVSKYYTDLEKAYLTSRREKGIYSTNADYERDVLRIWSAKESYMKYTGLGFQQDIRTFSVDLDNYFIIDYKENTTLVLQELQEIDKEYCGFITKK